MAKFLLRRVACPASRCRCGRLWHGLRLLNLRSVRLGEVCHYPSIAPTTSHIARVYEHGFAASDLLLLKLIPQEIPSADRHGHSFIYGNRSCPADHGVLVMRITAEE